MARRRKRLFWIGIPLIAVVAFGAYGTVRVNRMQAQADLLAETGRAAINMLKEYGAGLGTRELDRVMAVYDDAYASPEEGTWRQELRSHRDGIRVYEWRSEDPRPFAKADVRAQLAAFVAPIRTFEMSKLKLDRVEEIISPEEAVVRAFMWLRGTGEGEEAFETQVLFRMWVHKVETAWKIRRQELVRGTTVIGDRSAFTDVAAAAGIDFVAARNPKFDHDPDWHLEKFGILKYGSAGVTAADYDDDGWYDLFWADGEVARFYRNQGDGTFRDVTTEVGLPGDLLGVNVALFVDLDNDGDKDLFLARFTDPNLLYRNDGGTFTDVTAEANLGHKMVTVATAGDYDNDGDLDLYLGRYLDPRTELPTTLFYTRNSEGNSLLRNDGDLRFTEVTDEAGVREGGLSLGVAFADYDADGDQDLYVANDFGRNALLRNEGDGTFSDVSHQSDAVDFGFGMSVSWGDVDNDGDLDLYTSAVHSGQRWYGQSATLYQYLLTSIRQGTVVEDYALYKEIFGYAGRDWKDFGDKMVKGNSLLINTDGRGAFREVAEQANTNPFGWFWGSVFFDYDNDGWLDVYAGNGWITGKTHDDL